MTSRQTRLALRLAAGLLVVGVVLLPVLGFYAGAVQAAGREEIRYVFPAGGSFLGSVILAATAGGTALILGVPVALAISRLEFRGRRLLPFFALVPLAIPPTIQAYAWMIFPRSGTAAVVGAIFGTSPGGFALGAPAWGCGLLLGMCLWPIVAFLGAAGLQAGGGTLEEAAAPFAGEGRILRRIVLPQLWPSALVGSAIVYWLALSSFAVPNLLLLRTLSTEIFEGVATGSGTAESALMSSWLLVASVPVLAGILFLLRGRPPLSLGAPSRRRPVHRGRLPILALAGVSIGIGAFLPLASLIGLVGRRKIGQGGAHEAFLRALDLGAEALAHSALVAVAAATLATGIGFLAAAVYPEGGWRRSWIWAIGLLSFVLPGHLLGQGLTFVYNRPGPLRPIYEGWPILALGLGAALFLPAFAALSAALAGIPASGGEAAAVAGAGPVRRLVRITAPMLRRDIASVWLVIFTLAFGEAGAAILREPPGFQTAQVLLFNQMHYGRDQDVAALCLLSIGISLVPLAAAVLLWPGRRQR